MPRSERIRINAGEYTFDRLEGASFDQFLVSKDGVVVAVVDGEDDPRTGAPHPLYKALSALERTVREARL